MRRRWSVLLLCRSDSEDKYRIFPVLRLEVKALREAPMSVLKTAFSPCALLYGRLVSMRSSSANKS